MTEQKKWENIFLEDCAEYNKKIKEEQKAEELWEKADKYVVTTGNNDCTIDAYIAGYHECQKEHKEKSKTAYIKGIRTMANALKNYDRTDGAWTDYFEHTVDKVLKRLLQESE